MNIFNSIVLVLALYFLKPVVTQIDETTFDDGNYSVTWKYDMIEDTFYFNVTVQATGWIGFGVSENKGGMLGYDVVVGGVRNTNQGYHKDYFTSGQRQPRVDPTENYVLQSATEIEGFTKLTFYRKRDTGDRFYDVEIKPGMMYLVWAYHATEDITTGYSGIGNSGSSIDTVPFPKHTKRGVVPYTFIDAKYTIVRINYNYRLHWKYDKTSDMFYFTVVVRTTGWVAFGVSNSQGGMNGYDVVVGGVYNNRGYFGDFFTRGYFQPSKDRKQDYHLISVEERGGYTVLEFNRKRHTGDCDEDVEIKAGKMNIVWAYKHGNGRDLLNDKHDARGVMEYTFIPENGGDCGDDNGGKGKVKGKGSSATHFPSLFGITFFVLLQCVIGAYDSCLPS